MRHFILFTGLFLFIASFNRSFADPNPERSELIRFLISIPADLSDQDVIAQLKQKNYSSETKSTVHVQMAFQTKRYDLAYFMLNDGYIKPASIMEFFSKPFADNYTKSNVVISNHVYSKEQIIDYLQLFIDNGVKVNNDILGLYNDPYDPNKTEYFYYLAKYIPDSDRVEFDSEHLRLALCKKVQDINEVQGLMNNSQAVVGKDILTKISLNNLEIVKLLIDKGADVNYSSPKTEWSSQGFSPLFISLAHRNVDIVKLLLEKGADPCFKLDGSDRDALYYAKDFQKKAKSDQAKKNAKIITGIIKNAMKECK